MASLNSTNEYSWLIDVARERRLPDSDSLPAYIGGSLAEAWETVANNCHVSIEQLAATVAEHAGLEVADLNSPDAIAVRLIPERLARVRLVLAYAQDARTIRVATANPYDDGLEDTILQCSSRKPVLSIAPPQAIEMGFLSTYGNTAGPLGLLREFNLEEIEKLDLLTETGRHIFDADAEGGPIVQLTALIFDEALKRGASDIHIQPFLGGAVIRYRVDGVLRRGRVLPLQILDRVIGRIKAVSGMDVTNRHKPQDGRALLRTKSQTYDLRISTVPVGDSEKITIRVLGHARIGSVQALGIREPELSKLRAMLRQRMGLYLLTGPTGSGKTSTIYAALNRLNTADVNIMTVEDPVEYRIPGLAQIEVAPRRGVTFASALRAMLRQDPDIILVGEIRDAETADIAVQASLTGHLVLSTLHTMDAPTAIPRLMDLDVSQSLIADALRAVIAQRLVRQVCPRCGVDASEPYTEQEQAFLQVTRAPGPLRRAVGCEDCHNSGYAGRVPIMQIFEVTRAVRDLLNTNASVDVLRQQAKKDGMRSLAEAMADRVADGESTVDEAVRVLGDEFFLDLSDAFGRGVGVVPDAPVIEEAKWSIPTALIISQDRELRSQLRGILEQESFHVTESGNAADARRKIDAGSPANILILDIEQEGRADQDVLREAAAELIPTGLPGLIIIPEDDLAMAEILVRHGAPDYIYKPIDTDLVLARVNACLLRRSM